MIPVYIHDLHEIILKLSRLTKLYFLPAVFANMGLLLELEARTPRRTRLNTEEFVYCND
jgi:hypothetical protein